MKLLICTPYPLRREFGAPKIVIELAEELRLLGWECVLEGREETERLAGSGPHLDYAEALRRRLRAGAHEYDVVEYDHQYLPFLRAEFPARTLMVARSSLLAHHFLRIRIPPMGRGLSRLREEVARLRDAPGRRRRTALAQETLAQADLVNLANTGDRAELARWGIPVAKTVLLPYGIDRARRPLFDAVSSAVPARPKVAFVGTFDARKGGRDFPKLVAELMRRNPAVTVRLLGTAGLYRDAASVLGFFPAALRPRLEVIPSYAVGELPGLLADSSVGVFPSYIESFGFGVLEMMAAAMPVIAYDCPGPGDIVPPEGIVPTGDWREMAARVAALLADPARLAAAREAARARSRDFAWDRIARATADAYAGAWQRLQGAAS